MKCPTLLLPPSSIPPYRPPSPDFSLTPPSPPPVLTFDSRCLLVTNARRKETLALRQRWKQHQVEQQVVRTQRPSRFRHPRSAPPQLAAPTIGPLADLRKQLVAYGYGTSEESNVPCSQRSLQFPRLEQEVTKRNLTQRLPYHVKLELEEENPRDFPTSHPSSSSTFFLPARGACKPSSPTPALVPRARCLRSQPKARFFIHPEWASERVEWQRFVHGSHPTRFRYSWM